MFNRRYVVVLLLVVFILPSFSHSSENQSEETMFVTLTREARPINELPTNISVISAEQISNLGAKSIDQVLQLLPSIDVSRTGSEGTFSSIRMRGAPKSAHVLIVVDEQPYGGISGDQLVDVSRIPVDNIERIEVVRGGSSVLYGPNTIGGVIHIITKKKEDSGGMVRLAHEIGSFNTHINREKVGFQNGLFNGFLTYSRAKSDGFQRNADSEQTNGTGNVGVSFENGGRLSVAFERNDTHTGVTQGTSVPLSEWDGRKEREPANLTKRADANRTSGRVFGALPMGDHLIETTFFGSDDRYLSHSSAGAFDPDFEKNTHVLGNDTRVHIGEELVGGVSYTRDEYRSESVGFSVAPHHTVNVGAYGQWDAVWGSFNFIPALRFDNHSEYGNQWNPRLTSVWALSEALKLSSNIARSFRAPDFTELFFESPSQTPNPNLKPEKSWTYDVGVGITPLQGTEVRLTGYYTTIKDRINFVSNTFPTPSTYENTSQAEIQGLEFELVQSYSWFFHNFNYSYRRARGTSSNRSEYVYLALTPWHVLNYMMDIKFPYNTVLGNSVEYRSDQFRADNYTGIRLPPYAVWNAQVKKEFNRWSVFFGVKNILDRRYAESFDFEPNFPYGETLVPMDPRTYHAGLEIRLGS